MAEAQAESCPDFPDVFFLTLLINKFPLTEMKELEELETYVKDSEECSKKLVSIFEIIWLCNIFNSMLGFLSCWWIFRKDVIHFFFYYPDGISTRKIR